MSRLGGSEGQDGGGEGGNGEGEAAHIVEEEDVESSRRLIDEAVEEDRVDKDRRQPSANRERRAGVLGRAPRNQVAVWERGSLRRPEHQLH